MSVPQPALEKEASLPRDDSFPSSSGSTDSPPQSPSLGFADLSLELDDFSSFDLVGSDWVNVLSDAFDIQRRKLGSNGLAKRLQRVLETQKKIVNKQIARVAGLQQHPDAVKRKDKLAFVIGVTNLWVTALLLGAWPELLPLFYVVKTVLLVGIRGVVYRRKRWHYFMFDMCYYVNALLILLLYFPGSHPTLLTATWGLSCGPVLLATTAWRNSLVFHSLDKTTSLLIHFDPPLTLYTLRWLIPNETSTTSNFLIPPHLPPLFHNFPLTFAQTLVISVAVYLFWQCTYYVLVWSLKAENIRAGYATSTTYLLQSPTSIIHKLTRNFPESYRPLVFMAIQLVYTIVSVAPTFLFYHYQWLHAAALIFSMCMATWNGANFYFEVFSKRYIAGLTRLKDKLDNVDVNEAVAKAEHDLIKTDNEKSGKSE